MDRETIHILLVEDSETHAALIREALEAGHIPVKLTVAQSLAEAQVYLGKSTPHLAIIDLMLPDGSGTDLLQGQEGMTSYPAIVMSGQGDEAAAVEAMKAGALDYLVKSSATLDEMPRIVERVLREWRRTPLSAIIGYADLLYDQCQNSLDEQALNYLAKISSSGEMMAMLMDDLLGLSTIGKTQDPIEAQDTSKVVNEVVYSLSDQIFRAEVGVEIGDLPVVQVSKTLLFQVFDNLIGNAIRYGCKPGDVIEVGGERRGDKVCLYVRDHGLGIPIDEQDCIFEAFCRGTTGEHKQGTGIGLATVKKIARRFGGEAWVEETPGGGATFCVEMIV
jgi:light-regulated signal transduction histidine kinase (bacteriophytochrome)